MGMTASDTAVKAAQREAQCVLEPPRRICGTHNRPWTDRGCATAVAIADAVVTVAAREVLEAAADAWTFRGPWRTVSDWLRARAEALP